MLKKYFIIICFFAANNSFAKDVQKMVQYDCSRITSSASGFVRQSAFEAYFPRKTNIWQSSDNEVTILDGWGLDDKKTKNEAKNGMSKFRYRELTLRVSPQHSFTQVVMRLSAANYKNITPIMYSCKKAKNTSIDLDRVRKQFRE